MSPTYTYPRPSVTVDVALFTVRNGCLHILLIRRKGPPFQGRWALPGGFLDMDEELAKGARRELFEETGLKIGAMAQLGAFGRVDRDPRGRTVSVVYLSLNCGTSLRPRAGDDASESAWFPAGRLPSMAFDHRRIIRAARQRLLIMTGPEAEILTLFPRRFTLQELQAVYEAILERKLDQRSFRRRVLKWPFLEKCAMGKGKGQQLYRLDKARLGTPATWGRAT